ncbi:heat shock protein Hsp20 [Salinimicrobium sediminis]|uniref:Heat shock protein Hsp20 n=1 Tax=Salinimicrobium sediminis TaxID=1343891 RepID=A0A285X785_9FLAO|nr:Hsp20/alpha crystallin family protein [Salinimicrobium sediminis]SOC81148.1 heat shock protein Hsp20 [Salinimicrobium sediminis]
MSLIKSNKRRTPRLSNVFRNDPFFSDLMDRKSMFENFFDTNGDFDISPAMNIKEKEKEFEVELAAPGLRKEDFNITLDEGILTVSAQKEESKDEEKEGFITKEFSYNSFSRSISIPESIDEEKEVTAKYEDGVLKLKLHKKENMEPKKARRINIS